MYLIQIQKIVKREIEKKRNRKSNRKSNRKNKLYLINEYNLLKLYFLIILNPWKFILKIPTSPF